MKQCTKCKVEKELNQFQIYWHSTQQKHRTRGQCTSCYQNQHNERRRLKRKEAKLIQVSIREEIIQPVQPELQPAILENNPNYKQCRTCKEWKLKTEYYSYTKKSKKSFLDCRLCLNAKEVIKSRREREEYLKENGGSSYHKQKPGEWVDEYQKEATYNILKAIGWKLNEDNGIWWKEGIKTGDGIFINIKNRKQNKTILFENYPIIINTHEKREIFDRAVVLRNKGVTYKNIGYQVGLSETTVHKWLNYK